MIVDFLRLLALVAPVAATTEKTDFLALESVIQCSRSEIEERRPASMTQPMSFQS